MSDQTRDRFTSPTQSLQPDQSHQQRQHEELLDGRTGVLSEAGTAEPPQFSERRTGLLDEMATEPQPDADAQDPPEASVGATLSDSTTPTAAPEASERTERPETGAQPAGQSEGPGTDPTSEHGYSFSRLVDAFLSTLRSVAPSPPQQGEQQPAAQQAQDGAHSARPAQQPAATATENRATQTRAPESAAGNEHGEQNPEQQNPPQQQQQPTTMFFRMPFPGPDGSPMLIAFTPLPPNPNGAEAPAPGPANAREGEQPQTDADPSREPQRPGAAAGAGTGAARGTQRMPPTTGPQPVFVPLGASPFPFSFIFDPTTSTAWPLGYAQGRDGANGQQNGASAAAPGQGAQGDGAPHIVAGPPFHVLLDFGPFGPFGQRPPAPEQPDPERAAAFVKALERADAELRSRMARLGMGDIGGFGEAGEGALGCGICLEKYEEEDRPEWIAGQQSEDEAVVAVPCAGHHTLHAACLRDWLAGLAPSQWTCPFCREPLRKDKAERVSQGHEQGPAEETGEGKESDKSILAAQRARSLRDEVRVRERARGWRCDAPACLPRYPSAENANAATQDPSDSLETELVPLLPCRHRVHVDCLCTSLRIEADLCTPPPAEMPSSSYVEAQPEQSESNTEAESNDDDEEGEQAQSNDTVGKWVTCPMCRIEAWAELPLKRKPKSASVRASAATLPVGVGADAEQPDSHRILRAEEEGMVKVTLRLAQEPDRQQAGAGAKEDAMQVDPDSLCDEAMTVSGAPATPDSDDVHDERAIEAMLLDLD